MNHLIDTRTRLFSAEDSSPLNNNYIWIHQSINQLINKGLACSDPPLPVISFFIWSQVMVGSPQYNNKMLIMKTFLKETDIILFFFCLYLSISHRCLRVLSQWSCTHCTRQYKRTSWVLCALNTLRFFNNSYLLLHMVQVRNYQLYNLQNKVVKQTSL